MKKVLAIITALMLGVGMFSPALAATKEQQLQEILQLLDSELANWESTQTNNSEELADAVTTIYNLGITKYSTPSTYMATNAIRRDEAATMFYRLANKLDLLGSTSSNSCTFSDISQAHSDLVDIVVNSCKYGLFKGDNGKFLPTSSITNAQALTVLTRMLDGTKSENTGGHWALNYYNYMKGE
ncbi:MAG: hypothetical protein H6766_04370 [Candidatus Peribacteria bacterium]|nr:MAG: hypothetical protein H6766_04370 [Candidatus Peribacteria bacterium]